VNEFCQITTTTETQAEARKIAAVLVEQRLAACVHVSGPIESTYRWEGAVECAQEWVCEAKVRSNRTSAVTSVITELHSYKVPAVVVLPVVEASPAYLRWLRSETKSDC
jgi:periplasmic divalent cation tolerance protein